MKHRELQGNRKCYMDLGEIYFWTATINQWKRLLFPDRYKDIIISSLEYLTNAGKVNVFGFIIMPNHIHLIWRAIEKNGKESPQGSLLKYTAHEFRSLLYAENRSELATYQVNEVNKSHEFWQRDPLAIHLYSKKVAFQKLDYIHKNPLAEHWQLVKDPCDYKYSSSKYYETGKRDFSFLRDLREEF